MSGGTLPGYLLRETIVIEPYTGIGASGPTFAVPVTVRAHVQEADDMPRTKTTAQSSPATRTERTLKVWIRLGTDVPPGSRVTVRDLTTTATKVDINDGRGLAVPSHIEMLCSRSDLIPTATVTITRGTPTTDLFGDLVDSSTVVASAVSAAITENTQTRSAPVDQRGGVVETYTIRFASGTDVREGDRVQDNRTEQLYQVNEVTYAHTTTGSALGTDDVIATARRVAATSLPNT